MRFSTAFVALVAPLLAVAAPLRVREPSANDVLVLKFAHVLELLETDFYTQALEKFQPQDFIDAGFSSPELVVEQFKGIQAHETAHIAALEGALAAVGEEPLKTCTFDFSTVLVDVATMAAVARVVENVGVSAYLGAATLIDDPNILTAAGSILTIEARHQTILNVLNGGGSVPQAFDVPLSPEQVLALAGGFISGCDLGVPANPALAVTNTGAVSTGTKLEFSSTGIDAAGDRGNLTCQMLTGGDPFARAFPIDDCVVPSDINGPVYIYIANTTQPLQSNLNNQFKQSIVAGPALAFIDSKPELIGQLAKTSDPVDSSRDLTPDEAAGAIPSSTEAAATATETAVTATATESGAASSTATESGAASSTATESAAASSTTDAAAPATTSIDPAAPVGNQVPGSPQFEQLNQIVGPNTATGPSGFDNAVNVVGWSMVPASSI